MKIEQAHIARIRTAFEKMRSKEDLLHIMNEAKILVYGDKAVPFQLKQLTWYANPKLGRTRYVEFKIKKKVNSLKKGLKSLSNCLSSGSKTDMFSRPIFFNCSVTSTPLRGTTRKALIL